MAVWAGSMEGVGKIMSMLDFFEGKKVLITGHTGFKGSWLCRSLILAGAQVTGYALKPPAAPSLYDMLGLSKQMDSVLGDIRDHEMLRQVFKRVEPEFVIHLAAQPLVRDSYKNPRYTYETNVMGTVNVLECVKDSKTVRSFLNVTTDKVYENQEWVYGYRESDALDGFDPYSNSKSCSELITHCYKKSFFDKMECAISTARAGNVIGGGDYAVDRIIPDCVRAAEKKEVIKVRNPFSVRPYQHVLEPLSAYLTILMKQYEDKNLEGYYNVGPDERDCVTTGELVSLFCDIWGEDLSWNNKFEGGPHEANFLKLDCSKIKTILHWKPHYDIRRAMEETVSWSKNALEGGDSLSITDHQITDFFKERN